MNASRVANAPEVICPRSVEELRDAVRRASSEGRTINTSKARLGSGIDLDLAAMNAIECYEPGDLTMRVRAGAKVADVLEALAQHGQMLPFDMPGWQSATIGGVLASAAQGPLAASFGGVREYCIGVEFVTAEGNIARGGGMVVKNVAGYDLMKLLIGSRGTLAIIMSASFKLFPKTANSTTFAIEFAEPGAAVAFGLKVRRSALSPSKLEIVSPSVLGGNRWGLLVTASGSKTVVNRYRTELQDGSASVAECVDDAERELWDRVVGPTSAASVVCVELWTPLAFVLPTVQTLASVFGRDLALNGRIGIGNLNFSVTADTSRVQAALESVPSEGNAIWRYPRRPMDISDQPAMRKLKQALDPENIFNPGALAL